jgi:NAD dependent epimerase/dehydratase family enzyme
MMSIMRKTLGMPIGLPSPKLLLEFGAFIIGTETELLLKSRWVLPDKLLKSGFEFQFPELQMAIQDIYKQ